MCVYSSRVEVGVLPELGRMPVGSWRALDLLGKVWRHLGVLLVAVFRRSELKPAASYSVVDSTNKAWVWSYLSICCAAVLLLLLAGLGGEGEEKFSAAAGGFRGWLGCSSVPTQWRGVGRSWTRPFGVLSRWEATESTSDASSLNKRCHLSIWSLAAILFLLAGHGGEGKDQDGATTCRSGDWWGMKLQDGASHMVDLLCRHDLWLMRQPLHMPTKASIQPPRRRPFQGFPAASSLSPKWFCPRRWSPKCSGGEEGPDRVSCFLFRFFSAILEDCTVVFYLLRVLNVSCNSTDCV